MRDGVYKVTLESGALNGMLIGTLYEGAVTGCDETHHVTGTVAHRGNHIKGRMVMRRHARPDGVVEIANLDTITVAFEGIGGESFGQFDAKVAENPGLRVKASFQWLCEF